jgi:hypothetical protein
MTYVRGIRFPVQKNAFFACSFQIPKARVGTLYRWSVRGEQDRLFTRRMPVRDRTVMNASFREQGSPQPEFLANFTRMVRPRMGPRLPPIIMVPLPGSDQLAAHLPIWKGSSQRHDRTAALYRLRSRIAHRSGGRSGLWALRAGLCRSANVVSEMPPGEPGGR